MITDFSPINPHGRPAPNRHERRSTRKRNGPLFQVHVETRDGALHAIGPKAGRSFVEQMLMTINRLIIDGTEREWSNPHLVQVKS